MAQRFKTGSSRGCSGKQIRTYSHRSGAIERNIHHRTPPPRPPPESTSLSMLPAILLIGGSIAAISSSDKNEVEEQKQSGIDKFPGTLTQFPKSYKIPNQKLKLDCDPTKIPVILVACGSFSPITIMHLRLLEMCKDYFDSNGFEVVGGYISPVGDAYQKKGLVNAIDRTNMALLATQDSDWIMVDTWEASKPSWCRTVEVLDHFSGEINGIKRYKQKVQVIFVCGSDLLDSFNTPGLWADEDVQRICDHGLAVVTREGSDPSSSIWKNDLLYINRTKIHKIHQWIPNDISSTLVRLGISRGLSIRYLLPNLVLEYIKDKGLYHEEVEEDKYSK